MDVQTENMDPPPGESQSSGKIRKGFKLFGKRKPGNIFSIRSKGDGNNKSPVHRSKTLDGLSENAAPDSEQEPEKEKAQEVSQGEMEQAEEETLGEDGVLAAAHARTSISSASSAKSLSFLSLLRGGRRGVGDRRVQTVSQPTGRQRRGLKGLFGNVKFRSKDKEDKEEAPPSPLLMSSRANSVEIIKEDLTLTPKSHPRSLESPKSESCEPVTGEDSAATTLSETVAPQDNVSKTNEHVPPLPTSEPPMVPGDKSLSSLLADISSLLTFDSISGGGDIMADVEAEWGKASSAISAEVSPSSTSLFSKPAISSSLTSASVRTAVTAKPSPVAIPATASTKSFTPLTKTTPSLSPVAKPSTIITTLTKTSTLTTHTVKLSSDCTPAPEPPISIQIKSTPTAAKASTTPVMTSFAPRMSSFSTTTASTLSTTSTATTALPNTPATVVKVPSISPTLTSTAGKLASEIAAPPQIVASVIKPSPVAVSPPAPAKPPHVTPGPPTPIALTQPPPAKLDSTSNVNLQTFTSYKPYLSSAAGESKAPVTVSPTCMVTTKPSSPAPVISAKMTTFSTSTTTSGLASAALSKPVLTSSPMGLNQTPPSLVTVPHPCPSSTTTTKTQPSLASVPTLSSTSADKIPPTTKPAPASLDKMPLAPSATPVPTTHAVVSTASSTPPAPGQITVSQFKAPPSHAQIPISLSKEPPAPVQIQVSLPKVLPAQAQIPIPESKEQPAPAQIPTSVSKEQPAPAQIPMFVSKEQPAPGQIPMSVSKEQPAPAQIHVSQSKTPPTPAQIPISVSKDPPAPAQIQVSQSKAPPVPGQIPIAVSKDPPAPAQIHVSQSKTPPAPAQIPISVSKDPPAPAQIQVSQSKAPPVPAQIPVPVTKDPPAPARIPAPASSDLPASAQIQISQSKAPVAPTSATCPVTPLPSTPAPWSSTAPAKMRGSGQASVDGQLDSPQVPRGAPTVLSKTDELHNESRTSLQESSKERRPPQVKSSGLSKIPVVGGGRSGKIPVRESHHADDEANRDPPTPVFEEERPHFNSHDASSKDKISDVGAFVPTSKHTQEESQQPKVPTSLPRDSKIPVKHGAQSHTASQIPQAREPPRTKIPVSKVPVRRVGGKPAATGGSTQIRK
ncbi:uncharacterized protein AB9X84_019123 [Acanthopagrus schlegelii]